MLEIQLRTGLILEIRYFPWPCMCRTVNRGTAAGRRDGQRSATPPTWVLEVAAKEMDPCDRRRRDAVPLLEMVLERYVRDGADEPEKGSGASLDSTAGFFLPFFLAIQVIIA